MSERHNTLVHNKEVLNSKTEKNAPENLRTGLANDEDYNAVNYQKYE